MSLASPAPMTPTPPAGFSRRQWQQIVALTVGAVALYVGFRLLPTGTNLRHGDFQLEEQGANSLEFCDPSNPQFLPVVSVRSPVQTSVRLDGPAQVGQPVTVRLTLQTGTGKPIRRADLLNTHTRRLHVMAVDPTLTDYQHLHPEPGERPGEWVFQMTPRQPGVYRLFCDFMPAATARGLYASADFETAGGEAASETDATGSPATNWAADHAGYHFALSPSRAMRAGESTDLTLRIRRADGEAVPLQEVMGAFAHLVAFDRARTGFAHLHPRETDLSQRPDATEPALTFQVTIPEGGRYVVWAQVNLAGEEVFVPFWIDVAA